MEENPYQAPGDDRGGPRKAADFLFLLKVFGVAIVISAIVSGIVGTLATAVWMASQRP